MALNETVPDYWDWSFWWRHLVAREPGLVIGGIERPYLLRYYLLPRNPYLNLYLHKFLRSDDDRAEHSHPWSAASVILKGGYWEHREGFVRWRSSGTFGFLSPNTFHRVELDLDDSDVELPCWTLFVTGPRRGRTWHFKCPKGLVDWRVFTRQNGCGE